MKLCGELKGISSADKNKLEKTLNKRIKSPDIIDPDLAKKIAGFCNSLRRTIALLIDRDGTIAYLIVGTKQRVYLQDLGRYRLDRSRLRRLRLVTFVPADVLEWIQLKVPSSKTSKKKILVPEISSDLITDLEKLRLDMVYVISVGSSGKIGTSSMAYLEVLEKSKGRRETGVKYDSFDSSKDNFFNFHDFILELEKRHSLIQKKANEIKSDYAVLVGVYTSTQKESEYSMDELYELANSAGVEIADKFIQRRGKVNPRTVLGKGKIEELVLHALDLGADLLIFDRELSPGQLRAITKITELRVLDRSMLILDIFAQRAKSSEGRLQVELAQLKYSLPRLTESDSGLSRLTGGIGGRGPGETKLEISRRRVRDRIAFLEGKIEKISSQRELQRDKRKSRGVPVIAIVGYTNAGKSTLLNTITKGHTLVENKLFATLDPSCRRMRFPNEKEVVFIDTVGFIRNLPEELIGAFRATLEEVGEADLLLHVVDASHSELKKQIEVVDETLDTLGYEEKPRIIVLNKSDLISPQESRMLKNALDAISVSATQRTGIPGLLDLVIEKLNESFEGKDPGGFLELDSNA